MKPLLRYRAGTAARKRLREEGLRPENIAAFMGPASGPKWLVLAGLDRALLKLGLLSGTDRRRTLFVGSSAGGWRILALASKDPQAALQGLIAGYVHQVFTREDDAVSVSTAYREMLGELFSSAEIEHILDHPRLDIALHASRCRGPSSKHRSIQLPRLLLAAASSCLSPRGPRLFFERTIFHSCATQPQLTARLVPLDADNFLAAAMATGTVPIYMDPIESPAHAPRGLYIDGGLTDYHLNLSYAPPEDGVVLFPHYRERIAPSWFDKHLPFRKPHRDVLSNVLQIFPSAEFLSRLPDGRLPDRQDFTHFVDDPQKRIQRWHRAVALSGELGDELRQDLESGAWLERLETF